MDLEANQAERALVARAAVGDDDAFRQLVRAHESAVASVVIAMLGVGDDAEDVGQETFVRLLRALPTYRGDSSVRTFITRIAVNASLDMIAKRKRSARFIRLGTSDDDITATASDPSSEFSSQHDRQEEANIVRRAVDSLDGKHRAVVVLRVLEERSTKEAAELLGVPEGTVMSRLTRAMKKLEAILRPKIDR
ncbi:MAG: RNA polymerase sigma factor [Gemmatimonadaceae bacterium]